MKKFIFTIIVLIPVFVFSQVSTIRYDYDDAGNRERRYIIELPVTPEAENNTKQGLNSPLDTVQNHAIHINDLELIVYPNPNGGKFDIQIKSNISSEPLKLKIYSLSGTAILSKRIRKNRTTIDIADRENGVYIMTLVVGDVKKTITLIKN